MSNPAHDIIMRFWEFLTEGMITHPGYPASIQIPHAMAAMFSFRNSFSPGDYTSRVTAWHKLVGAYFCHGYGGSSLRDILLGLPISALSNPTVVQYYLVFGFWLINFSPGDFVYRWLKTPFHPLRLMMVFGEAVDDSTTITGAFEKGARLQPDVPAAPYVAALAAVLGGGIVRYIERKGRGLDVKTEWAKPTGRIQVGVTYTLVYAALRRLFGVKEKWSRLAVALFDSCVALAQEVKPDLENPALTLWKALARASQRHGAGFGPRLCAPKPRLEQPQAPRASVGPAAGAKEEPEQPNDE